MTEKRVPRRLAAILCADVVSYSRLMGEDEIGTRARMNHVLDDIVRPAIDEHRGRLFKTMGDGILVEFASVVDAVDCAVTIQTAMASTSKDGGEPMRLRIGVNLGDVIVEGDDIHGDGVNVAARLEGIADPGGICISRSARDQVRDKLAHDIEDLGEVEVKNISRPVRVFRVVADRDGGDRQERDVGPARKPMKPGLLRAGLLAVAILVLAVGAILWLEPWTTRVEAASVAAMQLPLPDKPSVAVLPFDVASTGEGDQAFASAVNDDLTRGLARVSGIFVIARGSTMGYVGEKAVPARVAEELGVRFVVRGALRRSGDRVRIDAELVDAISGRIVWSDRFDRASGDLFALQDEFVNAIAARVADDLSKAGDFRRFTNDVEAYFAWFEADRESWINTPEAYGKARALASTALARDPEFVRAKALLAFIETQRAYFKFAANVEESLGEALRAAAAAAADHPGDWYTQSVHAQALMNLRDYEGAVTAFERAIELDPANAALLTRSSLPLIFLGRGKEAEARLRVAVRLNPFHDWLPDQLLGQSLFLLERYEEAATRLEVARRKNPRFIGNLWWRATTYGQLGEEGKAREAADEIVARMPTASISKSFIVISDPEAMERYRSGLRAAGLPE
ncbi:MAG: adenylate/guanylate cyclase domain-containing protein [Alphaproteobacteria bacterium]